MQWAVSLGLLPLTLMFFQRFSLVAPLSNLLAVPWVGLWVTPLSLAALPVHLLNPWLGQKLFWISDRSLAIQDFVLSLLNDLP